MKKSELISKIRDLAKNIYANRTNQPIEPSPYPVMDKFPSLKDIMNDLFDFQYEPFVKEIQWVAPKPTTFRVILINDGYFYLEYLGENPSGQSLYKAKVEGKTYYLESIPEQQKASESINRLLRYAKPETLEEPKLETPEESPATEPEGGEEPGLEAPEESPA